MLRRAKAAEVTFMEVLQTIVVENTRSCNLRCRDCPTVYAEDYPAGFMAFDVFQRVTANISPQIFPNCALTGWGEPLLDPDYFLKLKHLKRLGFKVGSTTNFTLVTQDVVSRLLDAGLDQLNISWDFFHHQASGQDVRVRALRLLSALRPVLAASQPFDIVVNVVVAKSNLHLVWHLLEHLRELTVTQIGIIPLIMIPTRKLLPELLTKQDLSALQRITRDCFPKYNVIFPYLSEPEKGNCRSDIFSNVYVTYRGDVTPCCMLAMEFPNYTFNGKEHRTRLLPFGRLTDSTFEEIWNSEAYKAFRASFASGTVPEICRCCNVWRELPAMDHAT